MTITADPGPPAQKEKRPDRERVAVSQAIVDDHMEKVVADILFPERKNYDHIGTACAPFEYETLRFVKKYIYYDIAQLIAMDWNDIGCHIAQKIVEKEDLSVRRGEAAFGTVWTNNVYVNLSAHRRFDCMGVVIDVGGEWVLLRDQAEGLPDIPIRKHPYIARMSQQEWNF